MVDIDLKAISYDDLSLLGKLVNEELMLRLSSSNGLTFDQFCDIKRLVSAQKFAPYMAAQIANVFSMIEEPPYAIFDMIDKAGATYELHYATYSDKRGASFPQMLRLDHQADRYLIIIFFPQGMEVYNIPGNVMFSSVIRKN